MIEIQPNQILFVVDAGGSPVENTTTEAMYLSAQHVVAVVPIPQAARELLSVVGDASTITLSAGGAIVVNVLAREVVRTVHINLRNGGLDRLDDEES